MYDEDERKIEWFEVAAYVAIGLSAMTIVAVLFIPPIMM